MIDYNLAKELKDAGFPDSEDWHRGSELGYSPDIMLAQCAGGVMNVPTLSELIDACGEAIDAIYSPYSSMSEHEGHQLYEGWRVDSTNEHLGISVTGKTPEEAVARLWLALNRKHEQET